MIQYTNEQYNEVFDRLPQEIKDVISSSDTNGHLWKIGEKHSLHIDKVGIMSDLAFDVMMGIIATKNFTKVLADELGITPIEAANLARDIDENIFKPIKKSMIAMYGDGAPNKPSSSLVQFYEEDEEHKALTREDILRDIESPAPAKVRVEMGGGGLGAPLGAPPEAEAIEASPDKISTEIEVCPEEITGSVLNIKDESVKPLQPTPSSASPEVPKLSDSFSKLADMDLSPAMVMPREGSEEIIAVATTTTTPPQTPTPTFAKAPAPTPPAQTPAQTKAYTSDPYRESIN